MRIGDKFSGGSEGGRPADGPREAEEAGSARGVAGVDGVGGGVGGEGVAEDEAGGRADERDLPAAGVVRRVRERGVQLRADGSRAVPAHLEPHRPLLARLLHHRLCCRPQIHRNWAYPRRNHHRRQRSQGGSQIPPFGIQITDSYLRIPFTYKS